MTMVRWWRVVGFGRGAVAGYREICRVIGPDLISPVVWLWVAL
jgi:hypothetical protein